MFGGPIVAPCKSGTLKKAKNPRNDSKWNPQNSPKSQKRRKKKSQKCVFFLRPQKNRSGAAGAPKWYQKCCKNGPKTVSKSQTLILWESCSRLHGNTILRGRSPPKWRQKWSKNEFENELPKKGVPRTIFSDFGFFFGFFAGPKKIKIA